MSITTKPHEKTYKDILLVTWHTIHLDSSKIYRDLRNQGYCGFSPQPFTLQWALRIAVKQECHDERAK